MAEQCEGGNQSDSDQQPREHARHAAPGWHRRLTRCGRAFDRCEKRAGRMPGDQAEVALILECRLAGRRGRVTAMRNVGLRAHDGAVFAQAEVRTDISHGFSASYPRALDNRYGPHAFAKVLKPDDDS
jgi:hypothetical protein